jgi:hypothetical protein
MIGLMLVCTGVICIALGSNSSVYAQGSRGPAGARGSQKPDAGEQDENGPQVRDYKGVTIGMPAKEVRSKLGKATEQGDDQDYFAVSDSEMAQVFYDSKQQVIAVSINYVGDNSGAPAPQAVLGTNPDTKPDGGLYKLVRYPNLVQSNRRCLSDNYDYIQEARELNQQAAAS